MPNLLKRKMLDGDGERTTRHLKTSTVLDWIWPTCIQN